MPNFASENKPTNRKTRSVACERRITVREMRKIRNDKSDKAGATQRGRRADKDVSALVEELFASQAFVRRLDERIRLVTFREPSEEADVRDMLPTGPMTERIERMGDDGMKRPADREFARRLWALVERHLSQGDLSVRALTQGMYVTRGQLNRRVKTVYGVTLQQLVIEIRLEKSRALLQEEPGTLISEVAYRCGFEDSASYSRAFRRAYGETPTDFRRRIK